MKTLLLNLLCLMGLHNWTVCYKHKGCDVVVCKNCMWELGGQYRDDIGEL